MQPVQDLTVEDRVSRTQFQYTLEDADAGGAGDVGAAGCSSALQHAAGAARRRQRPAERRPAARRWSIDRDTAVAAGHHAADDRRHALRRLRPAAGLDHLHAAEPVPRRPRGRARVPAEPGRARAASTCAAPTGRQVPLHGVRARRRSEHAPLVDQPPGAVPGGDALVQPGARAPRSARRSTPSTAASASIGAAAQRPRRASRARRRRSRRRSPNEPLLILAALITVYIVLGVLYESYIHPITILSTLPSAGVGALLALIVCRARVSASSRSSASSCSSAS